MSEQQPKKEDLYVGCISGTSLDGLDIAIVRFRNGAYPDVLAATTAKIPTSLHAQLSALTAPSDNEIYSMGQAHVAFGRMIGGQVLKLLEAENIAIDDIRAIGSHGQTIRHHPELKHPFTLQIGDPSTIAECTGIMTIADFRSRDIAAGGQGAPLACAYHRYLFAHPQHDRVVVNIGGMANVTLLHAEDDRVIGFDTGPGNVLLDAWCRAELGQDVDHWGRISASGEPLAELLSLCLQDEYFVRQPPKSTGREYFHLDWLRQKLMTQQAFQNARPVDVLATLVCLTADSIADALDNQNFHPETIWVCGGGRRNGTLLARLEEQCPKSKVRSIEQSGMDGDFIEAAAFAWLAREYIHTRPGNIPDVTGANGRRLLGGLYLP